MLTSTARGGLFAGQERIEGAKTANQYCDSRGQHNPPKKPTATGLQAWGQSRQPWCSVPLLRMIRNISARTCDVMPTSSSKIAAESGRLARQSRPKPLGSSAAAS